MAIQIFEQHNKDFPNFEKNEQVKYLVGKLYFDTGVYDKAKAVLNEQLASYPRGPYSGKSTDLLRSIEDIEKQKQSEQKKKDETSLKLASKKAAQEKRKTMQKKWALQAEAGAGNIIGISCARMNLIKSLDAGIGTGFDLNSETFEGEKYSLLMVNFNAFGLYRFFEKNKIMVAGRVQLGYNILKTGSISSGAMDVTPAILSGYMNFYAIISSAIMLTKETSFVPQIGIGYRYQF